MAQREARPCPECGTLVDRTRDKRKNFCSGECQARHARHEREAARPKATERECPQCVVAFLPARPKQVYCGKKCQQNAWYVKARAQDEDGCETEEACPARH